MTKLKLGPIAADQPVKVTLELPASLHRDVKTYADYLNGQHVAVAFIEGGAPWRI